MKISFVVLLLLGGCSKHSNPITTADGTVSLKTDSVEYKRSNSGVKILVTLKNEAGSPVVLHYAKNKIVFIVEEKFDTTWYTIDVFPPVNMTEDSLGSYQLQVNETYHDTLLVFGSSTCRIWTEYFIDPNHLVTIYSNLFTFVN